MRSIANLFVLSLASLSALVTVSAVPVPTDYITLARRTTVTVGGKTGEKGSRLSHPDHEKSTVHELTKWDGKDHPGAVVKAYNNDHKVKQAEIDGLKAAGQYIHHDDKHVVMHQVHGTPLAHMVANVPHDKRKEFVDAWKPKVAAHAADIAKNKGVLHGDMHMHNIIIHPEGHVQLVDWEHHHPKGHKLFTDDKEKIKEGLKTVWDSSGTPPQH